MKHWIRPIPGMALATVLLTTAGCASAPDRPERQLARAETSVEFAAQNGAAEYGPAALERARQHLNAAQRQADDGDYEEALRSAEKAELDAELAAAQTNTRKAEEALDEINDSIATLRRELNQEGATTGGTS